MGWDFVSQIPVLVNKKVHHWDVADDIPFVPEFFWLEDSKSPSFRGLVGKGARFLRVQLPASFLQVQLGH